MCFKILLCVLSLVIYIEAKSSYNYHSITSQIIEDIKKDHVNNIIEELHKLIDKLTYVKDNYAPQIHEEFQEKDKNMLECLEKYPERCTALKAENTGKVIASDMALFKNCEGFIDASKRVKSLLEEAEYTLSQFEESLLIIAEDLFNCTMQSPKFMIQCMANLKQPIYKRIKHIIYLARSFISDAEEAVKEITVDIMSCFVDLNRAIDDKVTKFLDAVK